MNKATLIILVTSLLFYHAASEYQRWVDVEQTFGVERCWETLGGMLNEACMGKGVGDLETVNFTACKMGCKMDTVTGFENTLYDMPNGTKCGFFGETCQNGICMGDCDSTLPNGCKRKPMGP
uniref:Putative ixostatin n=1 Tax=Ixodes ricinus TaxID=34613 RepID=A0A0K8RM24_IXORI